MKRVIIYHSPRWDLVSYGNGTSYALHDNDSKNSLFVQGDDALDFHLALEHYEHCFPQESYDNIMAELMYQLT